MFVLISPRLHFHFKPGDRTQQLVEFCRIHLVVRPRFFGRKPRFIFTCQIVEQSGEPLALHFAHRSFEFDALVFATGFDAMTGAIVAVDIEGRNGTSLKQKWADGPLTYLGLMVEGFPNFYAITGPGSPSVLSNMIVTIEQHVNWIMDCIDAVEGRGAATIEPTAEASATAEPDRAASSTLAKMAT